MVNVRESACPICGGKLMDYDRVKRIVRTKGRATERIDILRCKCERCGHVHRVIPDVIFSHKQYEAELIIGVLEGIITTDTLGYEDYPCEATMNRWRAARDLQTVYYEKSGY